MMKARLGVLSVVFCFVMSVEAVERPNVLFIIADDWGRGHAGVYGTSWINTPSFDRLAHEGLLFRNAYTPCAKCAPSRSSILTGRNPWQLKEAGNHVCYFPQEFTTYAEALTTLGFHVGMTGKGWGPGEAKDAMGKNRSMAGKVYAKQKTKPPTTGISNDDYASNFNDFLDDAKAGEPWVFWCGMREPHRGYEYGSGVAKGGKKLTDIDHVPSYWPDTEPVRHDMLDYAFEVEYVDSHVTRMLAELEKRGQLDNTLIIMTSDNGMPFPRVKGNTYEDSNHLPFAVRWPQGIKTAGVVIEDYISFIDIVPTILEVLQVPQESTGMATITGQSLVPIFSAGKSGRIIPQRDHVLIGRERNDIGRPHDEGFPVRGIVSDDGFLLINYEPNRWPACNPETGYLDADGGPTKTAVLEAHRNGSDKTFWDLCFGKRQRVEFYNLKNDANCLTNIAEQHTATVNALTTRLESILKTQGDPRMFGQGAIFDSYPHAAKDNVGFYERYMAGEKLKAGWVNKSDFETQKIE